MSFSIIIFFFVSSSAYCELSNKQIDAINKKIQYMRNSIRETSKLVKSYHNVFNETKESKNTPDFQKNLMALNDATKEMTDYFDKIDDLFGLKVRRQTNLCRFATYKINKQLTSPDKDFDAGYSFRMFCWLNILRAENKAIDSYKEVTFDRILRSENKDALIDKKEIQKITRLYKEAKPLMTKYIEQYKNGGQDVCCSGLPLNNSDNSSKKIAKEIVFKQYASRY